VKRGKNTMMEKWWEIIIKTKRGNNNKE